MRKFTKNLVWVLATFVALALIFSVAMESFTPAEILTLDQLAGKVAAGEVESITARDNDLAVTLKGGEKFVTKKESGVGLLETLINYGVTPERLRAVAIKIEDQSGFRFWAGILIPTILPIIIIAAIFFYLFRGAKSGMNQAFTFGQSSIRSYNPFKEKITFKDVAGLKEAKQELEEVVEFLKQPKKFEDLGARTPRGVLLVGAPGTGKTLIARAIAGEAEVPFFFMSASEFVEMFVGVGASRSRDAFEKAKKAAPSILFIDEIDAIGRQRGAGLGGGHDEREQTLNQILTEMDGFERDTRVIVLAATNRPDILDPALLRPGRFDRRVMLDIPDIKEREDILRLHAKDKIMEKEVNLNKVAVRTPGFTGADLANLMNEAAILAARNGKKQISQQDVYDSVEKVMMGPERRSRVISERERKITAYHEAGHAVVAANLKGADPVHKVSIVSRGLTGGYTLKLPLEDRRIKSKTQFLADLATLLGGYAAEEMVFKETSTGPSNDLKVAYEIARQLVTKFGMSERVGPVAFSENEEMVFLGREITTEKTYSEETAQMIDEEVKRYLMEAQAEARGILSKNKKALKAVAEALLEKEVLEQEEFEGIIKSLKIKD